jgi:hypothetical protein
MFDRAVQTAFVCLRCESRLLRQRPACSSLVRLRRPKPTARWQSTAAARVEDEDDNNEDRSQEEEFDTKHSSSDSLHVMRKSRKEGPPSQYNIAYRKFRPDGVAELGVSSLGKPAEVLVLQPRDRHIPKMPTEDDGQEDPQLLEALQAETAPLDPEQVKHNIEQIKKQFGDGDQILDDARWNELRYSLVKGFTHVQLLDYIRHMEARKEHSSKQAVESTDASSSTPISSELSRIISEKPDLKRAGRNKIKKRAAVSIMKDIWGFSHPTGEEEAEDMQSATVSMSRHHIGALKAQKSQPFKKVSELLQVKIDIFQEKNKLVVYGGIDAVEEARKALISMRSQITSINIDFGKRKYLLPNLREGKYEQKLLDEAGRNRAVYVEKKNLNKAAPSVRIFYHQSDRQEAEAARRDILLAGRRIGPRSSISVWPQLKQQSAWLVPYTAWQALPWWERLSSWGRWSFLQEADTEAQKAPKAPPTDEVPTTALIMEVYQQLCRSNTKSNPTLKSEPITQQHTVLFGQAVFRRDLKQQLNSVLNAQHTKVPNIEHRNLQHSGHPASSSSPKIITDIPLLAQCLASCKPWSVLLQESTDSRSQSALTGQFVHRLLLLPVTAEPTSSALVVYLKGDDLHLGLRQPLRIYSISAVLEERSHVLLLPDRAVDVEFRRQTLYHIYTANRKRNPKHNQFNGQFLRYLNQAQGHEVPGVAPVVTLSLPAELADLFKLDFAPASSPNGIEAPSRDAENASPLPASLKSPRKVGAIEYVLAASETVETASFSHSAAQGLCLDHIHFSALDGMQSRQELRLAERPYPDTLAKSASFPRLFDGAYGVASGLGDPKLSKEQA